MIKKIKFLFAAFLLLPLVTAAGQSMPWSQRMANTVIDHLWPDSIYTRPDRPVSWSYDQGVVLKGIECVWKDTGKQKYIDYIRHIIDKFVTPDGSIRTYRPKGYRLDDINNGKILLLLYKVTGNKKYWKAATLLMDQLKTQPRNASGGFWHKKIYPNQMWLDGLYMAEPFYAQYAGMTHDNAAFDDITHQFELIEKHARDSKTGLLYHGWDESKQQRWANPVTGDSPNFWGRAMGWYAMALVDALDYIPQHSADRDSLVTILNRLATAVTKVQDSKTGLWWQVLNMPHKKGNYLEASASCMFVYSLAKGVRKGYLPRKFAKVAEKGYKGIIHNLIKTGSNGQPELKGTCSVAGLGGHPYRSGSFHYYVTEPVQTNDPKGIGAFIMASWQMEHLQ
ncbi:MAG TPA: glycoside hydrolase family 88 protein [Balneolales bacterium]|nr:glycoside hydrolase family 88 protein [Balneolales bacterium]